MKEYLKDYIEGARVVYMRGIKETLIGQEGIIITPPDRDEILYVKFTKGTYPCWAKNLDILDRK